MPPSDDFYHSVNFNKPFEIFSYFSPKQSLTFHINCHEIVCFFLFLFFFFSEPFEMSHITVQN